RPVHGVDPHGACWLVSVCVRRGHDERNLLDLDVRRRDDGLDALSVRATANDRRQRRSAATTRPSPTTSSSAPTHPATPKRSPNSMTPRTVAVSGSNSEATPAAVADTDRRPAV